MIDRDFTCLEQSAACRGAVEYRPTPPDAMRSFVRCQHHSDLRWDRYEGSLEQEANSPLAPSWFDPSYAGESWDED